MTRAVQVVAFVVGVILAGGPVVVFAQAPTGAVPSGAQREVRGQVGASINNAGLQNTLDVSWTWRTSTSRHPLLSGAHIATGVTHALTPTQVRLGGWFEYSPLSILDLRAGFDPSAYFGTFDSLMGFSSYGDPFDPDARQARGGARTGMARRVYVAPTLKFKAGPFVASSTAEVEWWRSTAGAAFFYEPTRDTLLKSDGDRLITTTSAVMHQWGHASSLLSIGALHTLSQVSDVHYNRIQKLGVIAIKEFAATHYRLPKPRVTVVVAKYLEDPMKQGEWTAALAVGFRK